MKPSQPNKICIIVISLAKGGAERSNAILSQMLHRHHFDVHIALLTNKIDYEYSGTLFNLGLDKDTNDSLTGRIKRFQKLRKYLVDQKFDSIIDARSRPSAFKEFFYNNYIFKGLQITYLIHSANIEEYFTPNMNRAKAMVKKADTIVCVSKAIAEKVNTKYNTNKTITIYNAIPELATNTTHTISGTYILFLGRFVESIKNFSLLLESYKASKVSEENVSLKIIGEGPDRIFIEQKIEELGLQNDVELIPFTPHIKSYLENALFLTLTSVYEGFPMVLIEALSVGTPVVSVDCVSGPNEIVIHEQNGLLIENNNVQALSQAYRRMVIDKKLLLHCKEHAIASIAHLQFEKIALQWKNLLLHE